MKKTRRNRNTIRRRLRNAGKPCTVASMRNQMVKYISVPHIIAATRLF